MKLSIVCLLIVIACAMATPTPHPEEPKNSMFSMAENLPFFGSMMKGGMKAYNFMSDIMKKGINGAKNLMKGKTEKAAK